MRLFANNNLCKNIYQSIIIISGLQQIKRYIKYSSGDAMKVNNLTCSFVRSIRSYVKITLNEVNDDNNNNNI